MKLVNYEWNGANSIGVLDGGDVVPIGGVDSMIDLIKMGDAGREMAEGVGFARKPPVFMQPSDRIVVEVEKIGRLENHFV